MKEKIMKKAIVLLMVFAMCGLATAEVAEPNKHDGQTFHTMDFKKPLTAEQRIVELEEKIKLLETRIEKLESRLEQLEANEQPPAEDPNETEFDCEKAGKRVQEAKESVELARAEIASLVSITTQSAENEREIDSKKHKLLAGIERNLTKIIHFAEKCPDIGVDVVQTKKELIKCQADKREMEMKRKASSERVKKPAGEGEKQDREKPKSYYPVKTRSSRTIQKK